MPQISRNPVHKDIFFEIRDDFLWALAEVKSPAEVKAFFYDFFTRTERIMFAKRLAVALMLHKGYRYDDVRFILHVSTSTITRIANWLDQGGDGVKRILDKLIKEEKMELFWNKVNRFIDKHIINPRLIQT